jgi:RimJ/RimL family protein N-acetyltransferase
MQWPDRYSHFPQLTDGAELGSYALQPIRWNDRESIRNWRNAQLKVLRQIKPLTAEDQDRYFQEIVFPQFDQELPPQFMFGFYENQRLVGYGALVHIHWGDHRAEVSFLTDPERLDPATFESDWTNYLELLKPVARNLGIHKLTTETYAVRTDLMPILEANGFISEGVLRDHHFINDFYTDSHVHGVIL